MQAATCDANMEIEQESRNVGHLTALSLPLQVLSCPIQWLSFGRSQPAVSSQPSQPETRDRPGDPHSPEV